MRPNTIRYPSLLTAVRLVLAMLCVVLGLAPSASAKSEGQLFIRDDVSAAHRNKLLTELRKITGWTKLTFADDGRLTIDSADTRQGSSGAQALVVRAVSGDKVIVLEDASSRSDVAFCRVVPGKWNTDNFSQPPAYVILIDFTDFEQIVGDKEARASFHVGWGLLHELDHVVSDTADSEREDDLGECEVHINAMRAEVGLPVRASYFFKASPLKTDPNFRSRFVRLPFEQRDTASNKTKRYWLTWDAAIVGGLTKDQSASVRALVR
jgi:hypothetical protein